MGGSKDLPSSLCKVRVAIALHAVALSTIRAVNPAVLHQTPASLEVLPLAHMLEPAAHDGNKQVVMRREDPMSGNVALNLQGQQELFAANPAPARAAPGPSPEEIFKQATDTANAAEAQARSVENAAVANAQARAAAESEKDNQPKPAPAPAPAPAFFEPSKLVAMGSVNANPVPAAAAEANHATAAAAGDPNANYDRTPAPPAAAPPAAAPAAASAASASKPAPSDTTQDVPTGGDPEGQHAVPNVISGGTSPPMSIPDVPRDKGGEPSAVTNATQDLSNLPPLTQQKASVFAVLLFGLSVTAGLFSAAAVACMLASKFQAKKHQQQLSPASGEGRGSPSDAQGASPSQPMMGSGASGVLGASAHAGGNAMS